MQLSIVIVNYKTPSLTNRCLSSIIDLNINNKDYEIIVIDNNSEDDSEELITNSFPQVIWVNNHINEGFGRANNIGINKAKGDYILFLNSDMVILDGTIEQCLFFLKENKQIGALGCKLINEDGSLQKSTYPYIADYKGLLEKNLAYDKFFKDQNQTIKGLMGSFLLIPINVISKVGGFDPDFFMYSEEMELCYRISKSGFKIVYFDKVKAVHVHGASSTNKRWATRQNYLSNALLFYKIKGVFGYILYHLLFITNSFTNFILMWLLDKNYRTDYFHIQLDYFSNFIQYLTIPILYKKKLGDGKRQLRKR